MDQIHVMQQKIESLHHVCLELMGVIGEYRAMPCSSLEERMFRTADRYKQRVEDSAPDSTMYMSMVQQHGTAAPVFVNSGRRLIVILRKAGAPEGKESSALVTFMWLRDAMRLRKSLWLPGASRDDIEAKVKLLPYASKPAKGTEGQKVVDIVFANGAEPGRARYWLNNLLEEVSSLNVELGEAGYWLKEGVL